MNTDTQPSSAMNRRQRRAAAAARVRHGALSILPEHVNRLLVPVEDAGGMLGIGRTKTFELIRAGHLIARKIGSRTVVEAESIRSFAASLPRAGGAA